MSDAFMLLLGLQAVARAVRDQNAPSVVPEPEFKPFKLPSRRGAGPATVHAQGADGIPSANTTRSPRTLEELGVPRSLARELEGALGAMGMMDGERIVGFTYRTPDGVVHPLRATAQAGRLPSDRAA